jgi:small ribosomal subunit Rsm22
MQPSRLLKRCLKKPIRLLIKVNAQDATVSQPFDLPPRFEEYLEKRLQSLGHSLKEPQKLAEAIRKLSNIFLRGGDFGDYWEVADHRAAYVSYFSVLNFLRARAVIEEARLRGFLSSIKSLADWGCGAGAATWALLAEWREGKIPEIHGYDQSPSALKEYHEWLKLFEIKTTSARLEFSDLTKVKADTILTSYMLNEIEKWPQIPPFISRIIIIEPSTHQAGRKLLQWREDMLKEKWYAWGPCTHQKDCPLLVQSGKDWCHHRINWNKPEWFYDLEKFLPMKNETLTLSYLLLSRDKPKENLEGIARIVGDEQEEKGKTRQMICRGPGREFLSWLHRDQISLKLKRGDLVEIGDVEPRGNELRVIISEAIKRLQR